MGLAAAFASPAQGGWWDDLGAARPKKVEPLVAEAAKLLDVPVAVSLHLATSRAPGRPHTPIGYSFRRWTVVPVSEPGFQIVVRRRSAALRALARRIPGDRILVRAVPRRRGAGGAVLEVLSVTGDGDPLNPEESAARTRADHILAAGNRTGAVDAYERLLTSRRLPDAVAADLHRACGKALATEKLFERAAVALRRAVELRPGDEDSRRTLALVEKAKRNRIVTGHAATSRPLSSIFGPVIPPAPRLAPPSGLPSLADKPSIGHGPAPLPKSRPDPTPSPETDAPPPPGVPETPKAPGAPKLSGPR